MMWKIEFDRKAFKEFSKLDRQIQQRISLELDKIPHLEEPKLYGKSLVGNLARLWRYRVGDYRIICEINDKIITILVLDIGHRKNIYD